MGLTTERRKVEVSDDLMTVEIQQIPSVHNPNLQEELSLVKAYREASPELKGAVQRILNVEVESKSTPTVEVLGVTKVTGPGIYGRPVVRKKVIAKVSRQKKQA
jgi:hypothetical protein